MTVWKKDPGGIYESHWIDLIGVEGYEQDDEYWSHASVKWDGCIHLHGAGNVPYSEGYGNQNSTNREAHGACDSYIHICDIDEFIVKLQKLRDAAKAHFGEGWPE